MSRRGGAYYRAKYARGRGRGRVRGARGGEIHGYQVNEKFRRTELAGVQGDSEALGKLLESIDSKQYGAYKQLRGSSWSFNTGFTLRFDSIQPDPYASPSKLSITVPSKVAGFPQWCYEKDTRRIALADYLQRQFFKIARSFEADVARKSRSYHGAKGGDISIDVPSQHVLERTAVIIDREKNGELEVRFTSALPARGRSILGRWAKEILTQTLPEIVSRSLLFISLKETELKAFIHCVEDQEALRGMLESAGLVAFVANGSILPRESGMSDRPMARDEALPFVSPSTLERKFLLPNLGEISGMGIKSGITVIVGGGYHGKSTLLSALENAVYNQIVGDGREFVISLPNAVKIRGEDGRSVNNVDISPFINNLPHGKNTANFSTFDASGSTSQAANLIESVEAGADTLLIDEDSCCTNFMNRDLRMQQLVPEEKEPITPFIYRVRQLYEQTGISSVLVLGSCGEYFDVADTVVMMDSYKPLDVTREAKIIANTHPFSHNSADTPRFVSHRYPKGESFYPRGGDKVVARKIDTVQYGEEDVRIGLVEQIVEVSQVRGIVGAIEKMIADKLLTGESSLRSILDRINAEIDRNGVKVLTTSKAGNLSRPRAIEIAAVMNRISHARFRL